MGRLFDTENLIIGAGPCGLFTAYRLPTRSSVTILDAGLELSAKSCPLEDENRCRYCRPVCNIMGGLGGAQFFEGTKLSRYPAGTGLLAFRRNTRELEQDYDEVDSVLERHGKPPRPWPSRESIDELAASFKKAGIEFKYYNAQKVAKQTMMKICEGLYSELRATGVRFQFDTVVERISRAHSGGFVVHTSRGDVKTKRIVLAPGRLGSRRLIRLADQLGIEYSNESQEIELGIRVEAPARIFKHIDNIHNDIKLKLNLGTHGEVRSFCQDYRGYITKCVYNLPGDPIISTFDGHIIGTEDQGGKLSSVVNLAVHHRFRANQGLDEIYRTVGKMAPGGKPVVQDMESFLRGTGPSFSYEEPVSIGQYKNGDVVGSLPAPTYHHIREFTLLLDTVIPGFASDRNAVIAPSFEMGWKQIHLTPSLETTVRNIYVGGDATGHFRGALQAAVSGLMIARAIEADQRPTRYRSAKTLQGETLQLDKQISSLADAPG